MSWAYKNRELTEEYTSYEEAAKAVTAASVILLVEEDEKRTNIYTAFHRAFAIEIGVSAEVYVRIANADDESFSMVGLFVEYYNDSEQK